MEKKDNIGMRVACDLVDSSQKKIEAINEMRKKQSKERGELNKKQKSNIEGLFSGMKKKKEMWFGTYFVEGAMNCRYYLVYFLSYIWKRSVIVL